MSIIEAFGRKVVIAAPKPVAEGRKKKALKRNVEEKTSVV